MSFAVEWTVDASEFCDGLRPDRRRAIEETIDAYARHGRGIPVPIAGHDHRKRFFVPPYVIAVGFDSDTMIVLEIERW